ncbi:MAG: AAA family ATPase, partial [Bacteroidota bacterium]
MQDSKSRSLKSFSRITKTVETPKHQTSSLPNYLVSAAYMLGRRVTSIPMLLESLLQQEGMAMLGGSSDVGKTTFLRQLAVAVATGQDSFLGFKLNLRHKRAIYVSSEDDEISVSALLYKQYGESMKPDELSRLHYIFDSGESIIAKIDLALSKQPADLVILDAFGDFFAGDMNANNQVRAFLNRLAAISKKYGCCIVMLHHTTKKSERNGPSKGNMIGSQGIEARMRCVFELRKDPNDGTLRHLCIVKGNYLSEDFKKKSIVIKMSDNMIYTNTGSRVGLGYLTPDDPREKLREERDELIVQYHNDGKSIREIEAKLNQDG